MTEPPEHVGLDILAAYREGLLSRHETGRVRSHLASCPDCASATDGLAEVTSLLAGAPVPPVPPEVSARIEAAISAESAARAAGAATAGAQAQPPPATAGHHEPVPAVPAGPAPGTSRPAGHPGTGAPPARPGARPGRDRSARNPRASRARLRALAATAAVVVIAGGGYGIAQLVSQGSAAPSASSGRPASGAQPGVPSGGLERPGAAGSASNFQVVASGRNYTQPGLADQVQAVVAQHPSSSSQRSPATSGRPPESLARLRACVAAVTGGRRPRLVDVARYRGKAAIVVVLPGSGGQPGRATVVGAACKPGTRYVLAQVTLPGAG